MIDCLKFLERLLERKKLCLNILSRKFSIEFFSLHEIVFTYFFVIHSFVRRVVLEIIVGDVIFKKNLHCNFFVFFRC